MPPAIQCAAPNGGGSIPLRVGYPRLGGPMSIALQITQGVFAMMSRALGPSPIVHLRPVSLLDRLKSGDPDAATELFERHIDTVERAIHGVLGPDAELEDLAHDAFLAAWKGVGSFRGPEQKLGAWVRGIAVKLALKKLRWRRRKRWWGGPGTDALPSMAGPTDTDTQSALQRAFALMDQLPDVQRAAFGLRFIEGMQLAEVADALGVSLATTKRQLKAARERFEALAASDALLSGWYERQGRA